MNCYNYLKSLVNFAKERDVNQRTKATWYIYNQCTTNRNHEQDKTNQLCFFFYPMLAHVDTTFLVNNGYHIWLILWFMCYNGQSRLIEAYRHV
jgi:hypothetical protein